MTRLLCMCVLDFCELCSSVCSVFVCTKCLTPVPVRARVCLCLKSTNMWNTIEVMFTCVAAVIDIISPFVIIISCTKAQKMILFVFVENGILLFHFARLQSGDNPLFCSLSSDSRNRVCAQNKWVAIWKMRKTHYFFPYQFGREIVYYSSVRNRM